MANGKKLAESLEALEAERIALQVQLRGELIQAARDLLPQAITQARGLAKPCKECGWTGNSSPALLRLISRLGMRDAAIDKARKR